ncbi:MAG: DUF3048 domain-containing protein [Candidatus Peribacteraceae bacterium]|nr:DUF3048 domain-containing protein [Candidatus Peribacteraceae bacterium]
MKPSLRITVGFLAALRLLVTVGGVLRLVLPPLDGPVAGKTVKKKPTTAKKQEASASWLSRLNPVPLFSHRKNIVAVMIENHETARLHQVGLRDALLVEEFLVEGYISRFAALYDFDDLPRKVGPVRSLRSYFIDGVLPWAEAVFHAGGSPDALARTANGDIRAYNMLFYYDDALRDESVPAPHNLFLTREKMQSLFTDQSKEVVWPPYETSGVSLSGSGALTVRLNFHSPVHNVRYAYQPFSDAYVRTNGEVEDQAEPRNVLILEIPVTEVGEHGRLTIPVEGRGRALLFRSGTLQQGHWTKTAMRSGFSFTQDNGEQFIFTPGQTWMTVLPSLERVTWSNQQE